MKLTLQQLKDMKPDTIFASGITTIPDFWSPGVVNIKWVAVRGGRHDWAIYHSYDSYFMRNAFYADVRHIADIEIARMGAKLHDMEKVQELVPCDKEALQMYRH